MEMDCNTTEAIRILAQLAEACADDNNYSGQATVLHIIEKIVDAYTRSSNEQT